MSNPQQDPAAQDCHIKPGKFPGMYILFGEDFRFENHIAINQNIRQPSGLALQQPHSFSFLMKGKTGDLTVRESYNGDDYQVYSRIGRDIFNVLQYNDLDENGNSSSTFTIVLGLKAGYNFEVQEAHTGKIPKQENWSAVLHTSTMLWRCAKDIKTKSRYLKVVVPRYAETRIAAAFNVEIARRILNQELLSDKSIVVKQFIKLQNLAVQAEDQLARTQKDGLARSNVKVIFKQLSGFQNRWFVQLQQQPNDKPWVLQGQERITLEYLRSPGTASPTIQQAGLLALEPTITPGKKDASHWRATVFYREGLPCAAINNIITPTLINAINTCPIVPSVRIMVEDDDDPKVGRMLAAVAVLEQVLEKQVNPDYVPTLDVRQNWHIPPAGYFMTGRRHLIKTNVPTLGVNSSDVPQLLLQPKYKLERKSHRDAFNNAYNEGRGVSIVQGPPATGKTELVSKLIAWTLENSQMPTSQSIVLSAHTNVAVKVACERLLKHIRTIFKFPSDIVCLVWTTNKSEWGRLTQTELDPELNNITLDAHLDRHAAREPLKFSNYIFGRDEIRKQGRIENKSVMAKYEKDVRVLMEMVKKQVRVWFATLATFHAKSPVFGVEKGWKGIDCGMLIIDEASQAHSLAAWLPWGILNPRRIILAGDHQQLAPHVLSTEAQWSWKQSMFEQLRDDTNAQIPSVMLDMQFRTAKNIYAGTNAFYDDKVESHISTTGRLLYNQLINGIKRIHFVDARNARHNITSNTHWFDIQNGQTIARGETSSSANILERDFVVGLAAALQRCGIPANECLMLTGYQAQYDDLLEEEKKLPLGGTSVKKVDSAQGDEAGIVLMSLVRTAGAGLGFMAQTRRQNVKTSRARDGSYGVGQLAAINAARSQNNTAWSQWFSNMVKTNGSSWTIKFLGPVRWYVDGREINLTPRPLPQHEPDLLPSSTFTGLEDVAEKNVGGPLPPDASGSSSPQQTRSPPQIGSPQRAPSPQQTGSPQQVRSRPSTPQQTQRTSPQARPNTPMHSSRGSISGPPHMPDRSTGSVISPRGTSPGQDGITNRTRRRSSILNPQHGRSSSMSQRELPIRQANPEYWADDLVKIAIAEHDVRDVSELRNIVVDKLDRTKSMCNTRERYMTIRFYTHRMYDARKSGNVHELNSVVEEMQNGGVPVEIGRHAVALSYAAYRLHKLAGGDPTWPDW